MGSHCFFFFCRFVSVISNLEMTRMKAAMNTKTKRKWVIAEPHPSEVTALVQRNVLCLALCWTSTPQNLYKAVGLEWLSWMRFDEDLTWTNIVGSDFGSKNAWREGGWSSRTLNDIWMPLGLPSSTSLCVRSSPNTPLLVSLSKPRQIV